jgi:hypothetical protein
MTKFSRYRGIVSFEVAGEQITLKNLTTEDMGEFMDVREAKEERHKKLIAVLQKIVSKSYVDEPAEEISAFISANYLTFMREFIIATKLVSKAQMEKIEREQEDFTKVPEKQGERT